MASGIFERLMRSVKELSKKDMRNYKITLDELQTVLLEIESIIKNYPYPYLHRLRRNQLVFSRNLNHSSLSESPVNKEIDIYEHREKLTNIINHFEYTRVTEFRIVKQQFTIYQS